MRWIESLWEAKNTTDREEDHKEAVLAAFRKLARQSRSEGEVGQYVPWQSMW